MLQDREININGDISKKDISEIDLDCKRIVEHNAPLLEQHKENIIGTI